MQSGMEMLAERVASAVDSYLTFTGDCPKSFTVEVARPAGTFNGKEYPVRVMISDVVLRSPDGVNLEDHS